MKFVCYGLAGLLLAGSAFADCERLSMGGVDQYTPYYWQPAGEPINSKELRGALSSLINKIGDSIGIPIDVGFVGPISRAQEELRTGHIDMMSGLFYNEERSQSMEFLYPPMALSHSRAWVHKDSNIDVKKIEDLAAYTGIAVTGYSFGEEFDRYAKTHLNILRVKSVEQLIKMVNTQRVDYMLYEELPGQTYINFWGGDNLKMLPIILSTEGIHMALSKNALCNTPELRQKLTQALKRSIQENWIESFVAEAQQQWIKENRLTP